MLLNDLNNYNQAGGHNNGGLKDKLLGTDAADNGSGALVDNAVKEALGANKIKHAANLISNIHNAVNNVKQNIEKKKNEHDEKKKKKGKDGKGDNKDGNGDGKSEDKKDKRSIEDKIVDGLRRDYPTHTYARKAEKAFEKGNHLAEKIKKLYKKEETDAKGIAAVAEYFKKRTSRIFHAIFSALPVLFWIVVIIAIIFIFKNAASHIFGVNDGSVYEATGSSEVMGVFKDYPGLYEEIIAAVDKVSEQYKLEIDPYIIVATLISPIDNGYISPVEFPLAYSPCKAERCYMYQGEYISWTEFVKSMGDQAEWLAKMQVLTYTYENKCKNSINTMEQYASNDNEMNKPGAWYEWLNPVNWVKGYVDEANAEKNYVCTSAVQKNNLLPKEIRVLSLEKAMDLELKDQNGNSIMVKNPNSGGVYYWNLVNKDGFLFKYLKDYLPSVEGEETDANEDKKYELSLPTILNAANYIYLYYEDIKKGCDFPDDYHNVIESEIKTIKVYNPPEKQSRFGLDAHIEIDFEEEYLGGVLLAEYNSGNDEALKAFAILARTEAVANVGVKGEGEIENSSNRQNYNPEYDINDEKYARITKAVRDTKGIVVADYHSNEVKHTEYDAFCPVKNTLDGGEWYYLPEGQQNLPINVKKYKEITGKEFIEAESKWLRCPCFQNADSRPGDESATDANGRSIKIKYTPIDMGAPTWGLGNPSQTTNEECWTQTSDTRTTSSGVEVGWRYKPSGGHGRGASQYGLTYFGAMGYDQDALIRLFFPGTQLKILTSQLPTGYCINAREIDYDKQKEMLTHIEPRGTLTEGGYTDVIGGNPIPGPIGEVLARKGYNISDLNECIADRVNAEGYGTREGVVAAGIGLLECTMNMTGGYTYPYDHSGGKLSQPDLNNKLGINSNWGKKGGTHQQLGLNCANYVRWALCNGGMMTCDRGSASAPAMTGIQQGSEFLPGAVRIQLNGFKIWSTSAPTDISTADEAIEAIKPGDVLYSAYFDNHGQHAMLIVGKDSDSITIAENGKNTRKITFDQLKGREKRYVVVLLDGYYANTANVNNLSW